VSAPLARSLHEPGTFPLPGELLLWWSWKPWILVPLLVAGTVYALGLSRLWGHAGRGSGVPVWRAASYAGGLAVLFVALVSPVDAWGAALFSAHMVQHLLLMVVAAPLLALGSPLIAGVWALPRRRRRQLAGAWKGSRAARGGWALLSQPLGVWVAHTFFVWLWHVPRLYEAALGSEVLHVLEHATFFLTALLFWYVLVHARVHRWFRQGAGVLYVFAAAVQSGVLGALITFSQRPWYPSHEAGAQAWGLTALEDQQLAGLLMWVPSSLIYVSAALLLFVGWLAASERRTARAEGSRAPLADAPPPSPGGGPLA